MGCLKNATREGGVPPTIDERFCEWPVDIVLLFALDLPEGLSEEGGNEIIDLGRLPSAMDQPQTQPSRLPASLPALRRGSVLSVLQPNR